MLTTYTVLARQPDQTYTPYLRPVAVAPLSTPWPPPASSEVVDALARITAAHPVARLAPPFRYVETSLPAPALMQEVVIHLPDGYFVGLITRYDSSGRVEVQELASLLRWMVAA